MRAGLSIGLELAVPVAMAGRRPDGPALAEAVAGAAAAAEAAGFEAVFLAAPPGPNPPARPAADPLTLAGLVARRTSTITVGVVVELGAAAPSRHPSLVARELTTVDLLGRGRAAVLFGVAASAVDQVGAAGLTEAVAITRRLLVDGAATVAGRRYWVDGAVNRPLPSGPDGPAIVVDPGPLDGLDQVGADAVVVTDQRAVGELAGRRPSPPVLWRGALPSDPGQAAALAGRLRAAGASGMLVRLGATADPRQMDLAAGTLRAAFGLGPAAGR